MAFTIDFSLTPKELVKKIRSEIQSNHGEFSGDEKSGNIKINTPVGEIAGNYKIEVQQLIVTISKKPFFVTEGMIKNEIAKRV